MDTGEWGYPEDFESRPQPKPNEMIITYHAHGFAGDRGEGADVRVTVLAPTDSLYRDLEDHNMVVRGR
jgi:hypothetical protein